MSAPAMPINARARTQVFTVKVSFQSLLARSEGRLSLSDSSDARLALPIEFARITLSRTLATSTTVLQTVNGAYTYVRAFQIHRIPVCAADRIRDEPFQEH